MAKNWVRQDGTWFPFSTLPASGPVLLTDETQTIQWLSDAKPGKAAVEHREHKRDDDTQEFAYDVLGKPIMASRSVKPAFWAPVVFV